MNDIHKHSRREFLGKYFFMAGLPAVASLLAPLSGIAGEKAGKSVLSFVPDPGSSGLEKIKLLLKQPDPLIWLFTGDSITAGVEHTHGYRSYPEVFGERIRWEMHRSRDIVINTGISGNTTENILSDFDWRITQFKPAVVSLMIGTNDCSKKDIDPVVFERNINTLLTKITELGAIPVLQTPNIIIGEKAPERARLPEYVAIIQTLSEKKNIVLIDNWGYWKDVLQNHPETDVYKNWLNDPLHPNGNGHREIADLIFKKLSIFDPEAATCGGKYYEGYH